MPGTRWRDGGPLGRVCFFEAEPTRLGIDVSVLVPGQPMAMCHYENEQEDFLVVSGEALLIVEGQERSLGTWDLAHCPPGTRQYRRCGRRSLRDRRRRLAYGCRGLGSYTVDPAALRHGAGVKTETMSPTEAYERFPEGTFTRYREGWLPRRAAL